MWRKSFYSQWMRKHQKGWGQHPDKNFTQETGCHWHYENVLCFEPYPREQHHSGKILAPYAESSDVNLAAIIKEMTNSWYLKSINLRIHAYVLLFFFLTVSIPNVYIGNARFKICKHFHDSSQRTEKKAFFPVMRTWERTLGTGPWFHYWPCSSFMLSCQSLPWGYL